MAEQMAAFSPESRPSSQFQEFPACLELSSTGIAFDTRTRPGSPAADIQSSHPGDLREECMPAASPYSSPDSFDSSPSGTTSRPASHISPVGKEIHLAALLRSPPVKFIAEPFPPVSAPLWNESESLAPSREHKSKNFPLLGSPPVKFLPPGSTPAWVSRMLSPAPTLTSPASQEQQLSPPSLIETSPKHVEDLRSGIRQPCAKSTATPKHVRIALNPKDGLPAFSVRMYDVGSKPTEFIPWVEDQVQNTQLDFNNSLTSLKSDGLSSPVPPFTPISYPSYIRTGETPTWDVGSSRHFTPPQASPESLTTPTRTISERDEYSPASPMDWSPSLGPDDTHWENLPEIEEEAFTPKRPRQMLSRDHVRHVSSSEDNNSSHSSVVAGPLTTMTGRLTEVTDPSTEVAGPLTTMTGPVTEVTDPSTVVAGPLTTMTGSVAEVAGPFTAADGSTNAPNDGPVDHLLELTADEKKEKASNGNFVDIFLHLALETSHEHHAINEKKIADRAAAKARAQAKAEAKRQAKYDQAEAERLARLAEELARQAQGVRRMPTTKFIQPLSDEWAKKVDQAMGKGDRVVLTTNLEGTELRKKDFMTVLGRSSWLNDEIVNASVEWIADNANRKAGKHGRTVTPKVVSQSSFFYTKIATEGAKSVPRWMKRKKAGGKDLFQVETVLIPINNASHWTMIVVSPKAKTLEYFDSFGGPDTVFIRNTKAWLAEELGDDWNENEWRVLSTASARQHNGYDCGVFAITNAECVASGISTTCYDHADMANQRRRIAAMLLNRGFGGELVTGEVS